MSDSPIANSAQHVLTILAVDDLPRSAAFYDAVFGWERTVAVPHFIEYRLPGGMRVGLYTREGFARNTGAEPAPLPASTRTTSCELYFYTEEPEVLIARLRGAGGLELSPFAERDWGDTAAYWADPDGNVLVIAKPGT